VSSASAIVTSKLSRVVSRAFYRYGVTIMCIGGGRLIAGMFKRV
jgi:hypothetical protein